MKLLHSLNFAASDGASMRDGGASSSSARSRGATDGVDDAGAMLGGRGLKTASDAGRQSLASRGLMRFCNSKENMFVSRRATTVTRIYGSAHQSRIQRILLNKFLPRARIGEHNAMVVKILRGNPLPALPRVTRRTTYFQGLKVISAPALE